MGRVVIGQNDITVALIATISASDGPVAPHRLADTPSGKGLAKECLIMRPALDWVAINLNGNSSINLSELSDTNYDQ